MLGDQDAGKSGMFVNFFGRPASSYKSIALLAMEYKALICVVDTVTYETANFCFSAVEMALLNDSTDFRRRTWLLMDLGKAEELSKYRTTPAERRKS